MSLLIGTDYMHSGLRQHPVPLINARHEPQLARVITEPLLDTAYVRRGSDNNC